MKTIIYVTLLLLFSVYTAQSQENWTVYNTSNSDIPSNDMVSFSMPDPDLIFMGTPGGLVTPGKVFEFDGANWTEIEWISGFTSIGKNPDGTFVIGNASGVYHYDGENYEHFNTDNSGLTANYIADLDVDAEGNEYFCMTASGLIFVGGLAIYDGTNWNSYNSDNSPLPVNNVLCVLKSNNGMVWMGTQNGGLVSKSGDVWEIFDTDNSSIPGNRPICIDETSEGTLWLGFSNRSIATFDGTDWEIIKEPTGKDFPNADITDIFIDASDNVWVSFDNNGFGRFDGYEWVFYTSQNSGLPHNRVSGFGENGQGQIWIGTYGGGLAVFEPEYAAITDNPLNEPDIHIYPNPVHSIMNIKIQNTEVKSAEIFIYNILGQQIKYTKVTTNDISLDCSELQPGIYQLYLREGQYEGRNSTLFIKR